MSNRRKLEEVDAAKHLNRYSNCVDVARPDNMRPHSYTGWSVDGQKMPCNGVVHNSTVAMSHSVDTHRPTHRSSGRRLRPLAVLELIIQKLKPNRRRRLPADAESLAPSAERQQCANDSSWQSDISAAENGPSKHMGVLIEDQSSYSFVSLATTSPCETPSQCSRVYSPASSVIEFPSGGTENSLTLAELLLANGSMMKDDVDDSRMNNAGSGPDTGCLTVLSGRQECSNMPVSCEILNSSKSSSIEFKQVPDRQDETIPRTVIAGRGSTSPDDQQPSRWTLAQELNRLSHYGWYWGPVTREEAEEKLTDQPEGAFLVRDSTDDRYLFSLSFRSSGRTLHSRVEYCNGEFSFYAQPLSDSYRSMVDLIERCVEDSHSGGVYCYSRGAHALTGGGVQSYPVKLTRPISRFSQVRSLQYLCRFVIRQHTRIDHIQNLPLPISMKGWLKENQY